MKNKRLTIILGAVVAILLVPFIAMQFSTEVNWGPWDFFIMGFILLSTGLVLELILAKIKSFQKKLLFCGILFTVFFLLWAELAVGLFGSLFAGS